MAIIYKGGEIIVFSDRTKRIYSLYTTSYVFVIFLPRTKVAGRSLYFFSPASRGGLSKPVFTTRETLAHMLEPGSAVSGVGGRVSGNIDRFDHIQNRLGTSAQHLLCIKVHNTCCA